MTATRSATCWTIASSCDVQVGETDFPLQPLQQVDDLGLLETSSG
jgi:hypothetical protein